jgi:phosphate:Na+ symporter
MGPYLIIGLAVYGFAWLYYSIHSPDSSAPATAAEVTNEAALERNSPHRAFRFPENKKGFMSAGGGESSGVDQPVAPAGLGSSDVWTSHELRLVLPRSEEGRDISGNQQIAVVGSRLTRPLMVQALGPDNHPAAGEAIFYLLVSDSDNQSPGGSGSGITAFPSSPLQTDANGIATLKTVILDTLGEHRVVFYTNPYSPGMGSTLIYTVEGRSSSWFNLMLVALAGGVALFLLGAKLTGEGLARLGGKHLREAMGRLDSHPVGGVGAGAAMTFLTQSSTVSTTMYVSFAGANSLTLRQSLPLIYGSAIGTTLTLQLLAFNVYHFALLAVAVGVVMQLMSKGRRRINDLGQGLLGFGLIFHGMHMMMMALAPLRRLPLLSETLLSIQDYPGWALFISMLLTGLVHSSAAVLGLVLALARQDLITPMAAVPIIFGANIGTTVTALMASMGLGREARRVAVAHLIFKIIGVLLFLPFMSLLAWLGIKATVLLFGGVLPLAGGDNARTIANIHSIFNVLIALAALPLTGYLETLARKIIPPGEGEGQEAALKYLDLPVLDSPAIVFGSALREISRMGRFVEEQMKAVREAVFLGDETKLDFIHRRDDKVDALERSITRYLTAMMRRCEGQEEINRMVGLLQIVSDIEHIGDVLDKDLTPMARKVIYNNLEFSPEGKKELQDFFQRVAGDLSTVIVALSTGDRETARQVRKNREALADYGKRLLIKHLRRLENAVPETLDSSSVHQDIINYLQRIEFHIYRISGIAAGEIIYHGEESSP